MRGAVADPLRRHRPTAGVRHSRLLPSVPSTCPADGATTGESLDCVTALFASCVVLTPPLATLIVPVVVIGPPVNPVPVAMFDIVPIGPPGALR